MPATTRPLLALYSCACLLALVLLALAWYLPGRAVPLADTSTADGQLQCVSYSPFGKHQSPFDAGFQADPARVDADLAQLAERFRCIRTYSVGGLENIPDLARTHGLKVLLGAWVSADPQATRREIDGAIALAQTHPDVIEAVIVGNEALLRKEVTGAQLVALIEQVRARIAQPVTYADVWEFWLRHPEVVPAVDFLTIHLLPYWEDEPLAVDEALQRVSDVRRLFGERYAPKDILIGETGWPSEGRQRETAVPSRVEQARFVRGFLALATENGWRYNLIEAYDQPWKRVSEGAAGGYWGLYDADRQDKGILAGPASNLPDWPRWLAASVVLWGLALLAGGRPGSLRAAITLPGLATLGAGCIGFTAHQALVTSRYAGEWLWTAGLLGLNVIVLLHLCLALSARTGRRGRGYDWLEAHAGDWLLAAGFAGAVGMLGLVFDARYRSFPAAALVLPGLAYLMRPAAGRPRELALLAVLIAAGILPQLWQETLANQQALGWAGACLLLVGALCRSLGLTRRQSARGLSGAPAASR